MKSIHDSIMATMLLENDETEREGHKHRQKEKDRRVIMKPPSGKQFCIGCVRNAARPRRSGRFLCFLVLSGIKMRNGGTSSSRCEFYSRLLPALQSDPMKRRTFGPLTLQTGRQ